MESEANIHKGLVSGQQNGDHIHNTNGVRDKNANTKMETKTRYKKSLIPLQKMMKLVCMQENHTQKQNIGFCLIAAMYIVSLIGCAYTIMVYEWLDKFKAAIIFFLICMLAVKYLDEKNFKSLSELSVEMENIYAMDTNSVHDVRLHDIFEKYARYTEVLVKWVVYILLIYNFTYTVILLLNSGALSGKMLPPLGYFMPGVDENTTCGIIVIVVQQMAMIAIGMTTEISYNGMLYAVFFNMSMLSAVIVAHVDEFHECLNMPRGLSRIDIRRKQINLNRLHSKYNEITRKLDKCFYNVCMAQMFSAVMFSILAIYMVVKENYMPAAPVILLGPTEIAATCVLGACIEIYSQNIYASIASLDWYLLPRNELKDHAILLHHSQQLQRIHVAGYMELNMETCLSTYKAIYTYTMVLYRCT